VLLLLLLLLLLLWSEQVGTLLLRFQAGLEMSCCLWSRSVGLYLSLLGFVFGGVVEYTRILVVVVVVVIVIVIVDVVSSTRQEVVVQCGPFMLTAFDGCLFLANTNTLYSTESMYRE
jgi:hypothetical protein